MKKEWKYLLTTSSLFMIVMATHDRHQIPPWSYYIEQNHHFIQNVDDSHLTVIRVRTGMENLEKSWNLKIFISRPEKKKNHKRFGKVMEMCYIHVLIHAVYILYALKFSLLV